MGSKSGSNKKSRSEFKIAWPNILRWKKYIGEFFGSDERIKRKKK